MRKWKNDKYARQVLTGLIGSSIIHRKNEVKNLEISSFSAALLETKKISNDILQNGIEGYKTLDELLSNIRHIKFSGGNLILKTTANAETSSFMTTARQRK